MKGLVWLESVTNRFGEGVALKPLSPDIAPGTLVTLPGPSGCGKTTTLRLIAGLERASEGKILIGGGMARICRPPKGGCRWCSGPTPCFRV